MLSKRTSQLIPANDGSRIIPECSTSPEIEQKVQISDVNTNLSF